MTARRLSLGLLLGMFLVGLALRQQLVGIGALFPQIQDDLDVSHAVVGLLATIPVLCMGVFAPPAPYVSWALGLRWALGACVGLIASFGVARALAPGAAAVILLTFPVGVGMGVAQTLMPALVKERFASRPVFGTCAYSLGMGVGGAAASLLAVRIADATNGWRGTLLAISLFSAILLPAWLLLTRSEPRHVRAEAPRPRRLPYGSGIVWVLVLVFCLVSAGYYGLIAWLPDAYVEHGWSEARAGDLVAVMNFAAIPASFFLMWAADRFGSRRLWLSVIGTICTVALVGVIEVPDAAWLWVVLIGLANGSVYPLIMTLPLDVAERPAEVGAVAGLMLGAGYAFSALAPFGLGVIRDASGSFSAALWALVAISAIEVVVVMALTTERLHRGVHGREPQLAD